MSGHVYWCEVCQRNVWDTHICNPAGDIEGRAEIKGKIMDLAKQLPDGSSEMFDEISELLDQLDKDELVEVLEYLNHIITINKLLADCKLIMIMVNQNEVKCDNINSNN